LVKFSALERHKDDFKGKIRMPRPIKANTITVERRPVGRRILTLKLPMPLHLVGCSPDRRGRRRADERWRESLGALLLRPRSRIFGPVEIAITLPETRGTERVEHTPDLVLSALVRYGVIDGWSSRIVRGVTLAWADTGSIMVEIRSVPGPKGHAPEGQVLIKPGQQAP
jgi:hypothetical protein